ncbi:MAG: KamA family radical SAM protein [Candidatus Xiphinematobacter sp.]|nr:MAG: KamA family radical SAM protein [Candidatus Xiphinematobacter sp.]
MDNHLLRGSARFVSYAPGFWQKVDAKDWSDWRWQLRERITDLERVEEYISLSYVEKLGVSLSANKLAMAVTPHFFNLIDPGDPDCPIRRQIIPRAEEGKSSLGETMDPCGEDTHMPVPGLVHRYPDRVLLLLTDRCASYCRYCTRSRIVSGASEHHEFHTDFKQALSYLRRHSEVRDVLLSGGDPLLFSDRRLEELLGNLRAIAHLEFLRIGTRIPVFLPQRITLELCRMLQQFHPLWMSIHANHPRELTVETREALDRLSDHGIPLGNQSVLLAGVNDNVATMRELVHKLLLCRVRPYYLYQCDLIYGSSHLRVPLRRGIEIIEGLRGHTTGYAIPQYVIDAPTGGGKIPINPDYVVYKDRTKVLIRNYEGKIFEYPEIDPSPQGDHVS